tara:strand:+ start:695 stop:1153 length:459 start_codon:yes stop_codon:yes gene_type:complete
MPELQISVTSDPEEFAEKIQINQDEYIYALIEPLFENIPGILDSVLKTYKEYNPSCMFCDTKMNYNDTASIQYHCNPLNNQQVIFSPIFVKHIPTKLQIYDNLTYHYFSFMRQLMHTVLPWHIPIVGFQTHVDTRQFQQITQDSQWVMQHVT